MAYDIAAGKLDLNELVASSMLFIVRILHSEAGLHAAATGMESEKDAQQDIFATLCSALHDDGWPTPDLAKIQTDLNTANTKLAAADQIICDLDRFLRLELMQPRDIAEEQAIRQRLYDRLAAWKSFDQKNERPEGRTA